MISKKEIEKNIPNLWNRNNRTSPKKQKKKKIKHRDGID